MRRSAPRSTSCERVARSTSRRSNERRSSTSAWTRCLIASTSAAREISMRMCDPLSVAFSMGPPTSSSPTSAESERGPSILSWLLRKRDLSPQCTVIDRVECALSQSSVSVTIVGILRYACDPRLTRSFRAPEQGRMPSVHSDRADGSEPTPLCGQERPPTLTGRSLSHRAKRDRESHASRGCGSELRTAKTEPQRLLLRGRGASPSPTSGSYTGEKESAPPSAE